MFQTSAARSSHHMPESSVWSITSIAVKQSARATRAIPFSDWLSRRFAMWARISSTLICPSSAMRAADQHTD